MSLHEFPPGEQLVMFGFPWHGLYTVPLSGPPYVELASGRKIYADFFVSNAFVPLDTFLVDHGLPAPQVQPDDPEAELLNVHIASCSRGTSFFNVWGGITDRRRSVFTAGKFVSITVSASVVFGGARVRAVFSSSDFTGVDIIVPTASLQGLPADYSRMFIQDITPDGKRWLIGLEYLPVYPVYPYRFRVDKSDTEGIGAILELVFADDFSSAAVNVLAGYTDCVTGTNINVSDGEPLAANMLWLVSDGTNPLVEYGSTEPPTPPYYFEPVGNRPVKVGIAYGAGTSVAHASRERVIRAWYDATGTAQLVKLKISTTESLTALKPERRTDVNQWWSPTLRTYEYTAEIKRGSRAYQPFFSGGFVRDKPPNTLTQTITFSDQQYTRTDDTNPVDSSLPVGEVVTAEGSGVRHDGAPFTKQVAANWAGSSAELYWNAVFGGSNKAIQPLARFIGGGGGADLVFEYIAGPAFTPAGLDVGDARTGNTVPGHNRFAPNFDQALWDSQQAFSRVAYNPITGQIDRDRLDGAYTTWI